MLETLSASLQASLGGSLPQLLGALAICIIGWFIAVAVRAAARKGFGMLKLNDRFAEITGQKMDVENGASLALFVIVLLLAASAVFNALNLMQVSGPFEALTTQVFEFLPRIIGAAIILLVAWLIATVVRGLVRKVLSKTTLDDRLAKHAGMSPMGDTLSNALYWLIILLFLPAALSALQMDGLLEPLREMLTKAMAMLPNIFAAAVIGGLGWVVATVLRNLVSNLLSSAGADKLGERAGLKTNMKLSGLLGLLAFVMVFIPSLIAALDALKVKAISKPATDMLAMLMQAVPHVIAASLILGVTWVVASFVIRLVVSLLAASGFDSLPAKLGMAHAFEKTSASTILGHIMLVFAMLFAAVEAGNQLGFMRFSDVITTFIAFAGDILLGSAILVIGFWLANVVAEAISRASGKNTCGLSRLARFAILGLVIAMGLRAMGIADDIVNLAFGLTLGAIAVAVALAFGLGGREAAGRLMSRWLDRIGNNEPK